MAARKLEQFNYTFEKDVVRIFGNISIGASGAPAALVSKLNKGIQSIVRNSVGNYTITFGQIAQLAAIDQYQRLLDFSFKINFASISAVQSAQVIADNSLAGNIIIQFSAAGSAVDPDNGSILLLEIVLKNGVI